MSVLQNPKCQFYITKPNLKKDTKEKDAKEKNEENDFFFTKSGLRPRVGSRDRHT